jgi:uncharacterized protein DUF4129
VRSGSHARTVGHTRRAVVAVVVVLVLLAVVGASARRPIDGGSAAPALPVWPLLVVVGAGLVLGTALAAATYAQMGLGRSASGRRVRPGPLTLAFSVLVPLVILTLLLHPLRLHFQALEHRGAKVGTHAPRQPKPGTPGRDAGNGAAALAAGMAAGIVGLAIAGIIATRRRRALPGIAAREALAAGTREAIDEIAIPSDPRAAVLAAYARMEAALASAGLGRRPSEAPREYLTRFEAVLGIDPRPAERLTTLFERARFSPHAIGEPMRAEALDALTALRVELEATA